MLGRAVEHGRPAPVTDSLRVPRQLDGEDLAALEGRPEPHQLGEPRVLAGDLVHLVADAARLVVRAPDGEAVGGLFGGELPDGLAALDPGQLQVDPFATEPVGLGLVEDHVELDPVGDRSLVSYFDALLGDRG